MNAPLKIGLASVLALATLSPALAQDYRPTEQYQRDMDRYRSDRAAYDANRGDYQQARRDYERRRADWEAARDDYDRRYDLIIDAIFLSRLVGYKVGFRFDPSNPDWPVVVIELPTGQVSWHMPEHPNIWDGHTTEEKFERIEAYRMQVTNCSK